MRNNNVGSLFGYCLNDLCIMHAEYVIKIRLLTKIRQAMGGIQVRLTEFDWLKHLSTLLIGKLANRRIYFHVNFFKLGRIVVKLMLFT